LGVLRLPGRTLPIPGWFPLVVDRVHPHIGPKEALIEVATDGIRLRLDLRDYVQRRIFYTAHERPEVAFVKRFLRPGDVFVDVGAHVGLYTLLAAKAVGPSGETHSFEPVPPNYASLLENVRLNGFTNTRLNNAAAGAGSGDLELGQTEIQPDCGQTSAMYTRGGHERTITAEKLDLGDYLDRSLDSRPIRLVKLDVEGMEPEILGTLNRRLAAEPPDAFMIEVNVERLRLNGWQVADVRSPLEPRGYRFFTAGPRGHLKPLAELPDPTEPAVNHGGSALGLGVRTRHWLYNVVALSPAVHGREASP
jgi:FkbM family methyltransferase